MVEVRLEIDIFILSEEEHQLTRVRVVVVVVVVVGLGHEDAASAPWRPSEARKRKPAKRELCNTTDSCRETSKALFQT